MQNAFEEVERLYVINAQHRKGWRLRDQRPRQIANHCREELRELGKDPNDIDELADVAGCLISLAIVSGFTWQEIAASGSFQAARSLGAWQTSYALETVLKAIEATGDAPPLSSLGIGFGFVYGYAEAYGWNEEHIGQRLLVKLATRFVNK